MNIIFSEDRIVFFVCFILYVPVNIFSVILGQVEPALRINWLCLLVSSADNLCKQFRSRSGLFNYYGYIYKVCKGAKIRSRYNQVPHLTQDTNGKVTNSQLDTTIESQEVSPFPAGDHKSHLNRRTQRHSKHKTEQKDKRSTKEVPPWNGQ